MSEIEKEYQIIAKIDRDILTCEGSLRDAENPTDLRLWREGKERLEKSKEFHLRKVKSLMS